MKRIRRDEQPELLKARKKANPDFYTLTIDSSDFGGRRFRRKVRKVGRDYRKLGFQVEKIAFFMRTRGGVERIGARFYMTRNATLAPIQ